MFQRRRSFLIGLGASVALSGLSPRASTAQSASGSVDPTPACADDEDVTGTQTEGPYFTPNSPRKRDLSNDSPRGRRFVVGGLVLDTRCHPIRSAQVEIWHADEEGAYDNKGFKLRGHQLSDARGAWWFSTIVPGNYPGRTRHFHFKVQRPGGRVLTTQLYFPGEPQNTRDGIFDESLTMQIERKPSRLNGRYDFILR